MKGISSFWQPFIQPDNPGTSSLMSAVWTQACGNAIDSLEQNTQLADSQRQHDWNRHEKSRRNPFAGLVILADQSCLAMQCQTLAVLYDNLERHAFHQALRHGTEWQETSQKRLDVRKVCGPLAKPGGNGNRLYPLPSLGITTRLADYFG
nr:hypothetical protein [Laribacter hongkongensis]